jgi:3-oxoacyl-[acyl-carrier-protein] synthase II
MNSSYDNGRRVVITGLGMVSPIGIGLEKFWASLAAGQSGVARIGLFPPEGLVSQIGGEVRDFNDSTEKDFVHKKKRKSLKVMCREIKLGYVAAMLALDDAGILSSEEERIEPGKIDVERLGVEFGANLMLSPPEALKDACFACLEPDSNRFNMETWGAQGLRKMDPLWLLQYLPNMPACHIGISADARGPNNSLTMAEASGNIAVGEATHIILRDSADMMVTGTTGTTLHPIKSIHAHLWNVLADGNADPARACRPFDKNRTGQVVGEGAGTMILEDEGHARKRGAKLYGRVLGSGSACVVDQNGNPDYRRSMELAMRGALEGSGIDPADIGHINAHGLATPQIDVLEAEAIHAAFGASAGKVPVTAFKSYWGNPGASCGTLELIGSIAGLQHGVVMPTLNYETPDPNCPLNVVAGKPLEVPNKRFLKLNVTRQGQASAVVAEGV